jgi:hypothetical protein
MFDRVKNGGSMFGHLCTFWIKESAIIESAAFLTELAYHIWQILFLS